MLWLAALIGAASLFYTIGKGLSEMSQATEAQALAEETTESEKKSAIAALETDLAMMEANLEQYEGDLSIYEQALENFGGYAATQKAAAKETGRGQYTELLGAFEGTSVALAAQGRTKGSGAAVTAQARGAMARIFGEDLTFNTTGEGLFAQQYQQLVTALGAKEFEIQTNIDLLQGSIETTEGAIENLEEEIERLKGELK